MFLKNNKMELINCLFNMDINQYKNNKDKQVKLQKNYINSLILVNKICNKKEII